MLTLLGIILIHQNGLKWCKTLDIALLGNRAPDLPGRPRIGTYVCTAPRARLYCTVQGYTVVLARYTDFKKTIELLHTRAYSRGGPETAGKHSDSRLGNTTAV